jgi:N-acetylmuramoyl-L-alanine amidase
MAAGAAGVGGLAVASRTGLLSGDSGPGEGLPRLELSANGDSDVASLEVALGDELLPSVGSHRWRSARLPTTTHSMVGFVWPREEVQPRLLVSSRRSGTWAPWRLVPLMHDLPDEHDEEWHGRAGTQLVWIGPADGIRIRAEGRRPDGLTLVLMHPRSRVDDALVRSPLAHSDAGMSVVARPEMSGRRVWGADESWRNGDPRYNATIEQVHVHHTANSNDYAEQDVPALLRGIYRYHTHSLGWSDIAYNFLVDRFGRAWVGRAGGAARPVRGAHTLGFNATSSGIAVIGNYDLVAPGIETLTAVVNLAAWKLSMYGRDPEGTAAVISEGSDKYARAQVAVLPVIDGHRDTNDTACPGQLLYDQLPEVRRLVQERIQAAQIPPVTVSTPFQLTGDPVVGGSMAVTPGVYSPVDAAVTYTWLRNGMPTGDDPALTVRSVAPEDVGQQIAVVVDLHKDGYTGATQTLGPGAAVETQAVLRVRARARRGKVKVTVVATAPGVFIPLPGLLRIRVDHRPWRTMPVGTGRTVARFLDLGPGEHEVKVRYRGEGVVRSVRSRTTVRVKN